MRQVYTALWFLIVFGVGFSFSQPATITFSQAQELIVSNHPRMQMAARDEAEASVLVQQVNRFENPTVGVEAVGLPVNELEVVMQQTIALGSKRALQQTLAKQAVTREALRRERVASEIETEILQKFIPIAAAQAQLTTIDTLMALIEKMAIYSERRVTAGAANSVDTLRIAIERDDLILGQIQFGAALKIARRSFAMLGTDVRLGAVQGALKPVVELPPRDTVLLALQNSPEQRERRLVRASLVVESKLLRAATTPDITAGLGFRRDGIAKRNEPLVALSLSVPLWERNQIAQKVASLQQETASQHDAYDLTRSRAEVTALYDHFNSLQMQEQLMRSKTLVRSSLLVTKLTEQYLQGGADVLEVLQAQREQMHVQTRLIGLHMEQIDIALTLREQTGVPIAIMQEERK